jgi:ArsR family transcriptional regulator
MMQTDVKIFKALSDSTRLRIVTLLLEHGQLCVCDIMESLEIPQSTASRHLSVLRNAGLVEGERRGVWMYYTCSGEDQIHTSLLSVLHQYRKSSQETMEDSERYLNYLKTKAADACAEQAD